MIQISLNEHLSRCCGPAGDLESSLLKVSTAVADTLDYTGGIIHPSVLGTPQDPPGNAGGSSSDSIFMFHKHPIIPTHSQFSAVTDSDSKEDLQLPVCSS